MRSPCFFALVLMSSFSTQSLASGQQEVMQRILLAIQQTRAQAQAQTENMDQHHEQTLARLNQTITSYREATSTKDKLSSHELLVRAWYSHKSALEETNAVVAEPLETIERLEELAQIFELHSACMENNLDKVASLLSLGVSIESELAPAITPIYSAISRLSFEVAEHLVLRDANLKRVDEDGDTLLHIAAFSGSHEMVDLLLGNGIKVGQINNRGYTATSVCLIAGNRNLTMRMLKLEKNDKNIAVIFSTAAMVGAEKIAEYILDHYDVDPDTLGDGNTFPPSFLSAARGNLTFLKFLQSRGSDLRRVMVTTDGSGNTNKVNILAYATNNYSKKHTGEIPNSLFEYLAEELDLYQHCCVLDQETIRDAVSKSETDENECVICQTKFDLDPNLRNSEQLAVRMNTSRECATKHIFHKKCLIKHLAETLDNPSCPTCRR